LLDGSIDTENIDNEVLLAVWCEFDGFDQKSHTRMPYFTSMMGKGLFEMIQDSLKYMGIYIENCKG